LKWIQRLAVAFWSLLLLAFVGLLVVLLAGVVVGVVIR
jgi:hypothetical protein